MTPILAAACSVFAIITVTTALPTQSADPQIPPGELVRAAVANEVAAANNTAIKFSFCSRKQTPKGLQNRVYVETNEALASALIGNNNQPLTPDQQRGEVDHLEWLARDRNQFRRKQARQKEDTDHTMRIVKALPDAFQYEYVGTAPGEAGLGKAGDELVKLKFTPNPSYSPPTRVEQVLTGMEGYLLIDVTAHRIARIEGTLFRDVTFGWGIFGRLDQGGKFRVQQADVGDGYWAITQMTLRITGKILLFKTLSLESDEVFNDFHRLPDNLPFAKGVELLQTEQEKLAQNFHAPQPSVSNATSQ